MSKTTRDMSDRHESHIAAVLQGRVTRGSGNQWHDQTDGDQADEGQYVFAWDGKSTLGMSVGVTRTMWAKIVEQAKGRIPLVPLRYYNDARLTQVYADLVVLDLDTLASLQQDANQLHSIRNNGCLEGKHVFPGDAPPIAGCAVCGVQAHETMVES